MKSRSNQLATLIYYWVRTRMHQQYQDLIMRGGVRSTSTAAVKHPRELAVRFCWAPTNYKQLLTIEVCGGGGGGGGHSPEVGRFINLEPIMRTLICNIYRYNIDT